MNAGHRTRKGGAKAERPSSGGCRACGEVIDWLRAHGSGRNPALRRAAIDCARRLRALDSRSARWIASDALRELEFLPPRSFKVVEDAKAAHERWKQERGRNG